MTLEPGTAVAILTNVIIGAAAFASIKTDMGWLKRVLEEHHKRIEKIEDHHMPSEKVTR